MTATPSTPDTVQELLELQQQNEDSINFQELACHALLKCTAEENAQVVASVLEALRDWHISESKEADNPLTWVVDATRLDSALRLLNLVTWE